MVVSSLVYIRKYWCLLSAHHHNEICPNFFLIYHLFDFIISIVRSHKIYSMKDLESITGKWCWNMLESTPARIPLIESSHKWTRILFIISNYKIGIWIFSQPRIDVNLQSNLYDVLTLDHTRLFPSQSTKLHSQNKFYIYFLQVTSLSHKY